MVKSCCADPIRLVSVGRSFPESNAIAPDIRARVKLEEKDALGRIPFDGPFTSRFSLENHQHFLHQISHTISTIKVKD